MSMKLGASPAASEREWYVPRSGGDESERCGFASDSNRRCARRGRDLRARGLTSSLNAGIDRGISTDVSYMLLIGVNIRR
jgi:hypothetical protein